MSLLVQSRKDDPAWRVIEYLQRQGSATIKEMETYLGVTTTAVRQHLAVLESAGYIERRKVNNGVGRPYHTYSTTAKVQELFACHFDDLALTLLEEVFELEGKERTALLLERVSAKLANRYAATVRATGLQARVEELAITLYDRGVLADVTSAGEDTIVLRTYNCPYYELAQEHREICEMDEKMMRQVLGSDVNLSACLFDGHGGCSFVVSARKAAQNGR